MAKIGILRAILNWLTGNTAYGKSILNALQTQGPLSYSKNKVTGETSGGLSSIINRVTQDDLTGAESAQNAFNAEEAQKNRDWQEMMSNTSYQRAVVDMRAAGINPALAMSQGGASTPSGATASGSLGSQAIGLSEIMELAMLKKKLKDVDADIALKGSQSEYNRAAARAQEESAGLSGANRALVMKQINAFDPMNQANLQNIFSEIERRDVQNLLDKSGIKLNEAKTQVEVNNAALLAIDKKTREEMNRLNLRLSIAELGMYDFKKKQISAEISELYQRGILHAAQAGMMSQQTQNLLLEHGILQLDKESKQFSVSKQNADRNWRIAGQVISSVVGVAGAAAGLAGGVGLLARARTPGVVVNNSPAPGYIDGNYGLPGF